MFTNIAKWVGSKYNQDENVQRRYAPANEQASM